MLIIKKGLLVCGVFLSMAGRAQLHSDVKIFELSDDRSFGLSLSPDGQTAYFVKAYGGRQRLEIVQSEKKNGKWSAPEPAFFSETSTREIDPFVSPDGCSILYNSRRNGGKDKDLDVWMVKKKGGKWGSPFPVDAVNGLAHETYATMTADGHIYFGVEKEGGHGGGDIYVSRWENGRYQPPQNIGWPVNTNRDEGNCFVASDESYIIYSANGHSPNFGGFDLYISFNFNGIWSTPFNLGSGINTAGNDFCPTVYGKDTLYFSRSVKVEGKLVENMYSTRLNLPLLKAMAALQTVSVLDKAFPDGSAYGITFSPDGKTAYTTVSNDTRSLCEVYSIRKEETGDFMNPQKMGAWNITGNVANPVVSHDGSFVLLRISGTDNNPDLYISGKKEGDQWQQPVPLPGYINTAIDQYYPELTPDNHLYYSSNGDVFYAEYRNGQWQVPTPVTALNTPSFSESNIAVSRDGNFLVFLSDRPGSYGSYDLLISKNRNGKWSEPLNLGPGINTPAMEYQPRFSPDNTELYFTRSVFKDGKRQGRDTVLKVSIKELLKVFVLQEPVSP